MYEVCAFVHAIFGPREYSKYLQDLMVMLKQQLESLRTILDVDDFDSVDIDPKINRDCHLLNHSWFEDESKYALLQGLNYENKLWLTIARISCLISVLSQAEFLPRNA